MATQEESSPAQWALDLLEPTPFDQSNHFIRYYFVPCSALISWKAAQYKNIMHKLPRNANVPFQVFACVLGAAIGYVVQEASDIVNARNDAVLRDYIRLHPERFPAPENKKFGDIFRSWCPVR